METSAFSILIMPSTSEVFTDKKCITNYETGVEFMASAFFFVTIYFLP